jgi:seryl-tRNA synthetase
MISSTALLPTSAAGVYLTARDFEAVVHGLGSALTTLAGASVQQSLRTPPVIARSIIERVGYHESFPHLLGRVSHGTGTDTPVESDLVLLPAGCYCVYPTFQGVRLNGYAELSIEATCFRQEESVEPGRLRSFRMREFVRLGAAEGCRDWRDNRIASAHDWLAELGLTTETVVASDPFFGSGSRLIRMLQVEQELKIELVAAIAPGQAQSVASGNYHKDQFGQLFAISDPEGAVAHSACIAFGYERLALALLHLYGENPRRWPKRVKKVLSLEALE